MFEVEVVSTQKYSFSAKDVIKYVGSHKWANAGAGVKRDIALKLLSKYIRTTRFELFNSFEDYAIILNGYREFKEVRLGSGAVFSANTIYKQMRIDDTNGCTFEKSIL